LRPDLVLVDIFLGEESGLKLARRLFEDGQGDRATVILISTHAEADPADLNAASRWPASYRKRSCRRRDPGRIVDGRSG